MQVVADTGPLNYLVLIDAITLLPKLFDKIIIPPPVRDELLRKGTPEAVRAWIAQAPAWLEVRPLFRHINEDARAAGLDEGERAAIALASAIGADLVLMDDRDGVALARAAGLAVTGTLGVLDLAARRGLINLAEAFSRLKATTFHYRQGLLDALLARQREGKE
jgi:predicted nucleic acid-binding protein